MSEQCNAEGPVIEDACCVFTCTCEKPKGHTGKHEFIYPGEWGKQSTPITWTDEDKPERPIRMTGA